MYHKIQGRVFDVLEARTGDKAGRFFMAFIVTQIVLNVTAVMLETVAGLSEHYSTLFTNFDIFSVAVFSVEYILRLWSCTSDPKWSGAVRGRVRYALTPMALIDLFAVLPFYLPFIIGTDLRFIRILRLTRFLRILKLGRYTKASGVISDALMAKKEELILSMAILLVLLIFASSAMYYVENQAQPDKFSSIPQAMWWGIATVTTLGYGDVYPVTAFGKVLGGLVAILGIAMIALPTGILGSAFTAGVQASHEAKQPATCRICPHCGKEIDSRSSPGDEAAG